MVTEVSEGRLSAMFPPHQTPFPAVALTTIGRRLIGADCGRPSEVAAQSQSARLITDVKGSNAAFLLFLGPAHRGAAAPVILHHHKVFFSFLFV